MQSSPLASRTALAALLSSISYASAQSYPGGQYFAGAGAPGAASYQLVDDYSAENFFDKFNYYDTYDLTWAHVQYVNESVADQNGYTYISDYGTAIIKPDTTNLWPRGGAGRPSIRITSDNSYYHGLFVFDATHIPTGCGTWPAYWLLGPNWPSTGEIDIIEGTNTVGFNTMAMHTSPNCSIAGDDQIATFTSANCDSAVADNRGCGSELQDTTALPNNYGVDFNDNGGGVYVTEWTSNYIKHWWFPRDSIPDSITAGAPDVSEFGVPAVNAQGSCDIDSHFQNMSIVINIAFCGSWAGSVYSSQYPNCPRSNATSSLDRCVDFVGNNPQSLTEAYWDINGIQVYQMPSAVATTSIYSTSLSSVTTGLQTTNTIPMGMGATTSTLSSSVYTGPLSSATSSLAVSTSASSYDAIVSTSASTWTSDGLTYTSEVEMTSWEPEVTPSLPDEPTYYIPTPVPASISDGYGDPSSTEMTSTPDIEPYPATTAESTIIETSVSEWISDGLTFSSTMEMTTISSIEPTDLPSDSSMTESTTEIAGYSSWTAAPTPPPAPSGCTYDYPGSFQISIRNASGDPLKRSIAKRQAYSLFTVSDGVLRDNQNRLAFITADWALTWSDAPSVGAIFTDGWSVCENGTLAVYGYSTFSACLGSSGFTTIYLDRGQEGLDSCTEVYYQAITHATSSASSVTAESTSSSLAPTLSLAPTFSLAQTASSSSASASASASASPAPPCPAAYSDVCGTTGQSINGCATTSGQTYELSCGVGYTGTTISDDQITPGRSKANSTTTRLGKRYETPDLATCQAACDATTGCIAVTFLPPTSCTLFSEVTGTYNLPGAVGAAQVEELPPPIYGGTSITTTQTQTVPSITTTVTGTTTFGLPTTTVSDSGSVVTLTPTTTTVVSTLPPGGSFTSITSGSSTGSFYVYTTTTSPISQTGVPQSVCYTCGIQPTICPDGSNCGLPSGPVGPASSGIPPIFTPTSTGGTCPRVVSGTGYVTIHTTYTYTTCLEGAICPNPGYIIIGGGGSMTSRPGQQIVTTTNDQGSSVTYTQVPTTSAISSSRTSGGGPSSTTSGLTTALPTCPYSNGASFIDSMGLEYTILCNTLFTDNTLVTQTQGRLSDCINSCDMYNIVNTTSTQCAGVSFIADQDTDNCLLKDGTTGVNMANTHSARLVKRATNPGGGGNMPSGVSTAPNPGQTATLISTAYLPGVTDLPTCSQTCIDGYDGCAEDDATCICSNQNLLQQWSCCVSQRCNAQGQADVISFAQNLCGDYGVTALPTMATCNTNPGNGPGTGPGTGIGATATATQYLPGVTDLPTCSQICIDGYDGCDENDATCICSNQNLLEQWSCCVSQRCSAQGQADVISFAENLCGEYGVTALPTVATCNTNPGSGPGPTVTQSGPGATVTQYLPGVTDLPTCSQLCIDGYDGCDENDATCICSNQNLLEQWSCCVSQRCNAQGQADVISFAENLCGEYGVTALPTVATCNTNPGSGPGPTSYVPSGVSTVVSNGVTVVSTYGTGPGTGPAPTAYVPTTVYQYITQYSTVVSHDITVISTVGISTVVSVSYVPASTNTITATTVSVSISNQFSTATATQSVYISGPTVTTNGGTATFTQQGPTVTASVGSGGSGGGGTITVTQGSGGSGGGVVTITAPPVTVTSYAIPSSSSSSSICRTTSTNYYKGLVPMKRNAKTDKRSLFSPEGPRWESPEEMAANAKPKLA